MAEFQIDYPKIIEERVTNGLGYQKGEGGELFPVHEIPESTISVIEHLGRLDEVTSPQSDVRRNVLAGIYWARGMCDLGIRERLSPQEFREARALIYMATVGKAAFDLGTNKAYLQGRNDGYSEGYMAGVQYGDKIGRLSVQTGVNILEEIGEVRQVAHFPRIMLNELEGKKAEFYPRLFIQSFLKGFTSLRRGPRSIS